MPITTVTIYVVATLFSYLVIIISAFVLILSVFPAITTSSCCACLCLFSVPIYHQFQCIYHENCLVSPDTWLGHLVSASLFCLVQACTRCHKKSVGLLMSFPLGGVGHCFAWQGTHPPGQLV